MGHPIIGDTTYGRGEHNRLFRERFACARILLHAWSLGFMHPAGSGQVDIRAPLDEAYRRVIRNLGWSKALDDWIAGQPGAT
jgi:tRNA pseudouridine65 synthase